jgi:hypothetical protein
LKVDGTLKSGTQQAPQLAQVLRKTALIDGQSVNADRASGLVRVAEYYRQQAERMIKNSKQLQLLGVVYEKKPLPPAAIRTAHGLIPWARLWVSSNSSCDTLTSAPR